MPEIGRSHYPQILPDTEIVCGGTEDRLPSLGRLILAKAAEDWPQVRIDIFARGVNPHETVAGIFPVAQEIIPVTLDCDVINDFSSESMWPYFEQAFRRNKRLIEVVRNAASFRFRGRPIENVVNVGLFGADY